jgi:NADP-dependent 3-hydroxy acid dehydrogenase YdfG
MTERLDGTVALVTGASSGLGEATAISLARHGAVVAIAARRLDRLEGVAQRIRDDGGTALVIDTDVAVEAQARAMVERTVGELGGLDILVNNAGVMLQGEVLDQPLQEWRRSVEVNMYGFLYTTYAALPHLVKAADTNPRRVSDMVNITSVAGRTMRRGSAIYNATKHAVGAFSEALRQEMAARYLRISVVEPGNVTTELRDHGRPEVREENARKFAGVVFMEASDIADAVTYIVTRRRGVAVNEMMVRPTNQEF